MNPKALTFYDPIEHSTLADDELDDANGRELIGDDDHGLWWGTERAFWVLEAGESARELIVVTGEDKWGHPFDGYFYGSPARVIAFVLRYRLKNMRLDNPAEMIYPRP